MLCVLAIVAALSIAAPVDGQAPATRELKAFIVSVEETKVTVSNVPLGAAGGGQTFVMPAPKDGAPPPTWVADSSKPAEAAATRPRMTMVTQGDDKTPLTLTELQTEKGAVKAADFTQGTSVTVTYREADGKKVLQKIARTAVK